MCLVRFFLNTYASAAWTIKNAQMYLIIKSFTWEVPIVTKFFNNKAPWFISNLIKDATEILTTLILFRFKNHINYLSLIGIYLQIDCLFLYSGYFCFHLIKLISVLSFTFRLLPGYDFVKYVLKPHSFFIIHS